MFCQINFYYVFLDRRTFLLKRCVKSHTQKSRRVIVASPCLPYLPSRSYFPLISFPFLRLRLSDVMREKKKRRSGIPEIAFSLFRVVQIPPQPTAVSQAPYLNIFFSFPFRSTTMYSGLVLIYIYLFMFANMRPIFPVLFSNGGEIPRT